MQLSSPHSHYTHTHTPFFMTTCKKKKPEIVWISILLLYFALVFDISKLFTALGVHVSLVGIVSPTVQKSWGVSAPYFNVYKVKKMNWTSLKRTQNDNCVVGKYQQGTKKVQWWCYRIPLYSHNIKRVTCRNKMKHPFILWPRGWVSSIDYMCPKILKNIYGSVSTLEILKIQSMRKCNIQLKMVLFFFVIMQLIIKAMQNAKVLNAYGQLNLSLNTGGKRFPLAYSVHKIHIK